MATVIKFGMIAAFFYGLFMFCIIGEYGFGYWIGAKLVEYDVYNTNAGRDYDASDVVSIFFAVITGAFSLGQVAPAAESIGKAKAAAFQIYKLIER